MKPVMGWYVDPKSNDRDAFWTGTMWSGARRPAEPGTPEFPDDSEWRSAARPPTPADSWQSRATAMYIVAGLLALGAAIGGIVLLTRTAQACSTNPYDDTLDECGSTHPFLAAGIAVIVVGLVQALVVYTVGLLCAAQAVRATDTA